MSTNDNNQLANNGISSKGVTEEAKVAAETFYQRGNEYRRLGNWQEAINCYLEAIELDPDSPAVHAKQMLDDILNYYNKDLYNP